MSGAVLRALAILLVGALGAGFAAFAVWIAVPPGPPGLTATCLAAGFLALALLAAWSIRRLPLKEPVTSVSRLKLKLSSQKLPMRRLFVRRSTIE